MKHKASQCLLALCLIIFKSEGSPCCRAVNKETHDCSFCNLTSIPNNIPGSIKFLDLQGNRIANLSDAAFFNLHLLTSLNLAGNNISVISAATFEGLTALQEVDLRFQAPYTIHKEAFSQLTNLRKLKLGLLAPMNFDALQATLTLNFLEMSVSSGFVFPGVFAKLRSLKSLIIYGLNCTMKNIDDDTFSVFSGSSIETLEVRRCRVESMSNGSLSHFSNLKTLNLACNHDLPLDCIRDAVRSLPQLTLRTLVLDGTGNNQQNVVTHKLIVKEQSAVLERLSLRRINVVEIDPDLMKYFTNLTDINIGYNSVVKLKYDNPNNTNATEALLEVNNDQLRSVDASHYGVFDNSFRHMMCMEDKYTDDFFRKPPPFIVLPTKIPTKHKVSLNYTRGEDLVMQNIPSSLQFFYANSFHFHQGIKKADINSDNDILFIDISNIDIGYVKTFLSGLLKLQGLNISGCNIKELESDVLQNVKSLTFLDLSRNSLQAVNISQVLAPAKTLRWLNLAHDGIREIPNTMFDTLLSLENITLSYNMITQVDLDFTKHANLTNIDLSHCALTSLGQNFISSLETLQARRKIPMSLNIEGNHFICDCNSLYFVKWIRETKVNLINRDNYMCIHNDTKTYIRDIDIHNLESKCNGKSNMTSIIVGVSVASVILVALVILSVYFKQELKVRWCSVKIYATSVFRLEGNVYSSRAMLNDNRCHAFLSYAENDSEWVLDTLVPKLEQEWALKVCYGEKDFVAGVSRTQNICDAVGNSRLTVVVLTPSYVTTESCIREMRLATSKGTDHVIVIGKEPVEVVPRPLKRVLEARRCIEYNDDQSERFWEQLQDAICPPTEC